MELAQAETEMKSATGIPDLGSDNRSDNDIPYRINLGFEPDSDNSLEYVNKEDEGSISTHPSQSQVLREDSQKDEEAHSGNSCEKETEGNSINSHYVKNSKLKSNSNNSTLRRSKCESSKEGKSSDEKSEENKSEDFTLTRRQLLLMFACCAVNMCSLSCVSLHAPFYPKVAAAKGASSTAAGFVFGIFQLTVFIMSLVYGSLLGKIGPKRMATTGILVMALSSMVFGLLDRVEGATAFITLSFIIRIIQANGNAGFVTASFAIIANEFPNSVAKAISYMETAAGLGLIIGPAVGGGLYEVGGFIVPFIVMGTLLLGAGILAFFFMPDVVIPVGPSDDKSEKPPGMMKLLSIPTVSLAAFSIFAAASAIGYLLPTLEPHVHKNFDLPESFTGLIFVIDGAMYALFNPMWGWLCDKFGQPRYISLIGSTLIFLGFCLIGPIPFLQLSPALWLTCVGCVIFGLGLGASFVSGFVQGLVDAKIRGFPDNVATYGLVSGMWFSMMSLGSFTGSSAGGTLLEHFGFQMGTYFVLAIQVIVAIWTIAFIVKFRNRKNLAISGDGNPEAPVSNSNSGKIKSVVAA